MAVEAFAIPLFLIVMRAARRPWETRGKSIREKGENSQEGARLGDGFPKAISRDLN